MAYLSTKTLTIIVLVSLINIHKCDDRPRYYADESENEDKEEDSNIQMYKDVALQSTHRNDTVLDNDVKTTTIEDYTTTLVPDDYNDRYSSDDDRYKNNDDRYKNSDDRYNNNDDRYNDKVEDAATQADATEYATDSSLDNVVDKSKEVFTDEINNNRSNDDRAEATTQPMVRSTDDGDDLVPRIADLDELDQPGQRHPKTENSDSKPSIDKRNFEPPPRPPPAVSKSSTLKSWLEDTWTRPPAGILVPLRPMALTRALAVWNDLTEGGLNLTDIVIVGYDSNGVNWRSRHNLQPTSSGSGDRAVAEALSKLLLKYQDVNSDSESDGTMRALAFAAKLVPYDSALFVVTDKGAGDPQRLPLALRALVEKRLKVYTIWTDPNHPSTDSEAELQELRNVSRHTEGDVLPYSLQVMEMDSSSNLASETDLHWDPMEMMAQNRRGRLNSEEDEEKFETLLVQRGGGEAISLGVPVENGVTALKIFIEGAVEHAVLYPPNDAPQIDLYNVSSVAAFSPGSITESLNPRGVLLVFPGANMDTDTLSVIPANPSTSDPGLVGVWHLSVRCDTCDYRLCIGARAQLHFNIESEQPDKLKFRITGPVSSVRESLLIDEYGTELAKLPYSYPPMSRDPDAEDNSITELIADVPTPAVKASRVYAKIVGRDFKGEPYIRLAGPLLHQSEIRMGRSAAITFPDSTNDLEAAEEINSRLYNEKLQYNDSNVLPSNRAISQIVNQRGNLLTAVQIGLSSRLYGSPGDNIQLHFEVTNYREQSVNFRFGAVGELRFLTGINPLQQTIPPGQTQNVIVSATITSTAQPGARDLVTFTAYSVSSLEQVSISAYIYVVNPGQQTTDVWAPELRHNFQGTCIGRTGDDCAQHVWSATIIARDAVGGLLRLSSSPIGLVYDSNFISGSREEVVATYRATCCAPRVVVTAVDAYGNANSRVVDISNYITEAGIAAIVLGVFLAIALIILISLLIYWCVKRRRESRELPSYSSRNAS